MSESWGYSVVCRLLWFLFLTKNCFKPLLQSTFLTISPALFVFEKQKNKGFNGKFFLNRKQTCKTIFGLVYLSCILVVHLFIGILTFRTLIYVHQHKLIATWFCKLTGTPQFEVYYVTVLFSCISQECYLVSFAFQFGGSFMALRSIIFMRGNRTPPWTSGCRPGRARPGRAGRTMGHSNQKYKETSG